MTLTNDLCILWIQYVYEDLLLYLFTVTRIRLILLFSTFSLFLSLFLKNGWILYTCCQSITPSQLSSFIPILVYVVFASFSLYYSLPPLVKLSLWSLHSTTSLNVKQLMSLTYISVVDLHYVFSTMTSREKTWHSHLTHDVQKALFGQISRSSER